MEFSESVAEQSPRPPAGGAWSDGISEPSAKEPVTPERGDREFAWPEPLVGLSALIERDVAGLSGEPAHGSKDLPPPTEGQGEAGHG